MIITRVIGGLGNQMFQYAAARALSLRLDCPLLLDIRGFDKYSLHNGFELDRIFSFPAKIATESEIRNLLGPYRSELSIRLIKYFGLQRYLRSELCFEPYFHFWSGINQIKSSVYLLGYWQSEKYFLDAEQIIREDFRFIGKLSSKNIETLSRIENSNSVAIHVRRGDYLSHVKNSRIFACCGVDYYRRAMTYISEKIDKPVFFVFSDDIDYVKEKLAVPFEINFIQENSGKDSHIDMFLMSNCEHQIIANSTFSWWGGWLNVNPQKIVVAPINWFVNDLNDVDLVPTDWVRL